MAHMKIVNRFGETKYSEERIGREMFSAVFNNVSTRKRFARHSPGTPRTIDYLNVRETPHINLCDVRDKKDTAYGHQEFTYSGRWKKLTLRRGDEVEFTASIYRLIKCKGKNSQRPGVEEKYELRFPTKMRRTGRRDKCRLKKRVKDRFEEKRNLKDELANLVSEQINELEKEGSHEKASLAREAQKKHTSLKKGQRGRGTQRGRKGDRKS